MTLEEAQKAVDSWIHEYGVRYFSELTNMAVLTEEANWPALWLANMAINLLRKAKKTTSVMK